MEHSSKKAALLKGCDPHAADVNTAAVGGGSRNPLTDEQWKEKKERYKDVACPKAVTGDPCRFHSENKCFYSHNENVVAKAKGKPVPRAKAKAKGKAGKEEAGKEEGAQEENKEAKGKG